jgi:predicted metal-dependent phosphoesterase TrpH
MIDLHVHTDASDGSLTPTEVVKLAKEAKLEAVGITDHENVGGTGEFLEACSAAGIEGISGVEIGVNYGAATMHLLGYFVDPGAVSLEKLLHKVRSERERRAEQVIERLSKISMDLDIDDVRQEAAGAAPGRPHIAIAMKKKGQVASIEEAFARYLKRGGSAYVERYKPDFEEAILAIGDAGGIGVLAHPISLEMNEDQLYNLMRDLKDRGLSGIEVYHPTQGQQFRESMMEMARKLNLSVTGGSDFHGEVKPEWKIGVGLGDMSIPYSVLDKLKNIVGR